MRSAGQSQIGSSQSTEPRCTRYRPARVLAVLCVLWRAGWPAVWDFGVAAPPLMRVYLRRHED